MSLRPLRAVVYWAYRNMPGKLRTRIVRMLTPNYTLGAVVLVRNTHGALLLVRKSGERGWSLPGGLLTKRERAADGAVRELAEEVNIRLPATQLTPATPNALVNARTQQVDCVFTVTVDTQEHLPAVDNLELTECDWYPVTKLPPLTVPTARLLAAYHVGPYTEYQEPGGTNV